MVAGTFKPMPRSIAGTDGVGGKDIALAPDQDLLPMLKDAGFKAWDVFEAAKAYAESQTEVIIDMQEVIKGKDEVIKSKEAEIEKLKAQFKAEEAGITYEPLHWDPAITRRGLGDAVNRCNHVAIIVADVGRSATFYSEVVGLQQITRPDFDRFGAWLTLGNLELHLIKGNPIVPSGEDLIVGHISLECSNMDQVLNGLRNMGIPYEQNISVPSGKGQGASQGGDLSNTVIQYFVRDPDGYYLEFCNCDVLTNFCLQNHSVFSGTKNDVTPNYEENGIATQLLLEIDPIVLEKLQRWLGTARERVLGPAITDKVGRWLDSASDRLKLGHTAKYSTVRQLSREAWPPADQVKLASLKKRQLVYCDITQSFSMAELENILRSANNVMPAAILLMQKHLDEGKSKKAKPPGYFKTKRSGSVFFYTPPELTLS